MNIEKLATTFTVDRKVRNKFRKIFGLALDNENSQEISHSNPLADIDEIPTDAEIPPLPHPQSFDDEKMMRRFNILPCKVIVEPCTVQPPLDNIYGEIDIDGISFLDHNFLILLITLNFFKYF